MMGVAVGQVLMSVVCCRGRNGGRERGRMRRRKVRHCDTRRERREGVRAGGKEGDEGRALIQQPR